MPEEIGIDHFKFYKVGPVPATGHHPTLLGQFDQTAQTVQLGNLRFFANPVLKNEENILDHNAHLTMYEIQPPTQEPPRYIRLEHQFGERKLVIQEGAFLLAPAQKIEDGTLFPKGLDHFKCYRVIEGDPIDKDVSLRDQFDDEPEVRIRRPLFFCVPVLKRYNNKIHEVNNPKAHLTMYEISPKDYKLKRHVRDQFMGGEWEIGPSHMLAIPSLKLAWGLA